MKLDEKYVKIANEWIKKAKLFIEAEIKTLGPSTHSPSYIANPDSKVSSLQKFANWYGVHRKIESNNSILIISKLPKDITKVKDSSDSLFSYIEKILEYAAFIPFRQMHFVFNGDFDPRFLFIAAYCLSQSTKTLYDPEMGDTSIEASLSISHTRSKIMNSSISRMNELYDGCRDLTFDKSLAIALCILRDCDDSSSPTSYNFNLQDVKLSLSEIKVLFDFFNDSYDTQATDYDDYKTEEDEDLSYSDEGERDEYCEKESPSFVGHCNVPIAKPTRFPDKCLEDLGEEKKDEDEGSVESSSGSQFQERECDHRDVLSFHSSIEADHGASCDDHATRSGPPSEHQSERGDDNHDVLNLSHDLECDHPPFEHQSERGDDSHPVMNVFNSIDISCNSTLTTSSDSKYKDDIVVYMCLIINTMKDVKSFNISECGFNSFACLLFRLSCMPKLALHLEKNDCRDLDIIPPFVEQFTRLKMFDWTKKKPKVREKYEKKQNEELEGKLKDLKSEMAHDLPSSTITFKYVVNCFEECKSTYDPKKTPKKNGKASEKSKGIIKKLDKFHIVDLFEDYPRLANLNKAKVSAELFCSCSNIPQIFFLPDSRSFDFIPIYQTYECYFLLSALVESICSYRKRHSKDLDSKDGSVHRDYALSFKYFCSDSLHPLDVYLLSMICILAEETLCSNLKIHFIHSSEEKSFCHNYEEILANMIKSKTIIFQRRQRRTEGAGVPGYSVFLDEPR
ncbi:hypothetical protein ADUPG1_008668 [Aduncisulcus paluster]|uniref:Uncharacterized protein n=1 Tax=Aduncisulcus paluster TaxID=2918883 RepID=A0ABQ5KST8_9EUKA|nr:hypothetical protein ADUPG1_008668 [Aduncisulcus paluster]